MLMMMSLEYLTPSQFYAIWVIRIHKFFVLVLNTSSTNFHTFSSIFKGSGPGLFLDKRRIKLLAE
jgi:hypothetical protein